jgi:hypothetical protein
MKSNIFLIAVIGTVLLFSCTMNMGSNVKYSALPPEGRNMPVQSFTSIKANGVFNIILQQGATESVVVKGQFPSDLKVTNDGNTLVIMDTLSNHTNFGNKKVDVYVTFKQLQAMETELVGETKTKDTIKTAHFSYESDGVGETNLTLNADSVTESENGVGTVTLNGKANYANIEDNGVGSLKAQDFKVHVLHASVNGVGSAKVYADSTLYLDVNGVGGLKYYGPARVVEKNSSGIGKVQHGE